MRVKYGEKDKRIKLQTAHCRMFGFQFPGSVLTLNDAKKRLFCVILVINYYSRLYYLNNTNWRWLRYYEAIHFILPVRNSCQNIADNAAR